MGLGGLSIHGTVLRAGPRAPVQNRHRGHRHPAHRRLATYLRRSDHRGRSLAAEVGAASREWAGASSWSWATTCRAEERGGASRYYESEHTKNVRDCKEEEVFDLVAHEPPAAAAGAGADGEVACVPEQVARGPAGLQVRIHLQPVY